MSDFNKAVTELDSLLPVGEMQMLNISALFVLVFFFPVYQVGYTYFVIHQGVGLSNRRSICISNLCQSNDIV